MHRCIGLSAAISVQNLKKSDIFKHNMSFATHLFPVANGALFVQNKLGWFRVRVSRVNRLSVRDRVRCHSGVSATSFKDTSNADSG